MHFFSLHISILFLKKSKNKQLGFAQNENFTSFQLTTKEWLFIGLGPNDYPIHNPQHVGPNYGLETWAAS